MYVSWYARSKKHKWYLISDHHFLIWDCIITCGVDILLSVAFCMYRYIVQADVPVVFVCMESSIMVEPLYSRHHWDPAICPV